VRDQNCPECNRLWREYGFATNEDIKLNGQMKLAALRYDPGLSDVLAPASEAATQNRESLRQQIKEHEAAHEFECALCSEWAARAFWLSGWIATCFEIKADSLHHVGVVIAARTRVLLVPHSC